MNIVMGKTVKIVPLSGACNRTKGCIEKYGEDGFEIVSFSPRSQRFGGTPALLVRETAGEKSRFNKWLGWLPLLEIGEENDTATT